MIKQVILALIICAAIAFAQDCQANVSGPNVASPARRNTRASTTCQADVSGPNVASPARRLRQAASQCSGNGYCSGSNCVCLSGYSGDDCQNIVTSTTCQADVSGPNVASPARKTKATQCNGNGSCNNGQCVCNAGFYGADCEVPVSSSCVAATPAPTTAAPTTAAPTTAAPTTAAPTTSAPTTSPAPADVSGPNVASPGRRLRQAQVCSGNGFCVGAKSCVCNAGYSGLNCEVQATTCVPATTTAAPSTAAPSTAAPTTVAPSTAAPTTVAPSTAAPTTTAAPSTPASTENTSGDNNARATSGAEKIISIGGIIAAIAVAVL